MAEAGVRRGRAHPQAIQQGMAHVAGKRAAMGIEDCLLEGKDHRQPVDEAGHAPGPPLAPGPHLGRDVEQHRDAPPMGFPRHELVEAGIVHQHHRIGTLPIHLPLELAHHPPVARDAAHDFHQAGGRELLHIRQQLQSRRPHLGPAHPHQARGGAAAPQGLEQMTAVQVPGGLPGHHQDAGRHRAGVSHRPLPPGIGRRAGGARHR